MLTLKDLDFSYPEELVAQTPRRPSRVMWVEEEPCEISVDQLLEKFNPGDLLILNNTKVLKRRVFVGDLEILFLKSKDLIHWQVLFPASRTKIGDRIELPLGETIELISKGRPQEVRSDRPLTEDYFEKIAEIPLPPYIQKARQERHTRSEDSFWYQTAWAEKAGSLASPTASLHFTQAHLEILKSKNIQIHFVTLHVGLGTFLPVTTEILDQHKMHFEEVEIPIQSWQAIQEAKAKGFSVWALGTTSARALESAAAGKLEKNELGFFGSTDLMIAPPYDWKIVDKLLTNFHQPQSTLLALVAGFSSLEKVKSCYQWAIERKFRLFSYGDLSVWIKPFEKSRE